MNEKQWAPRHNLRLENHSKAIDPQDGPTQLRPARVPTGETTVTCACGLDTGALPSDDARLIYEQHRHLIRDESTARG
ncbi:hypothetical protein ACIOD1_09170 [Streptomyces sp. NPDC088097]|uniref:hypothetical protein n=1 Tax=Streptomyces sp. NPDC088097 TaxID=3365823 RepID=UPI0037FAE87F